MNRPLIPRPHFWDQAAEQKRNRNSLLSETFLFFLLTLIASLLQAVLCSVPLSVWLMHSSGTELTQQIREYGVQGAAKMMLPLLEQPPAWYFPVFLFAGGTLGIVAAVYCTRIEKRKLSTMGLTGKNGISEYLLGLIIGLVMFSCVFLIGCAAGVFRLSPESLSDKDLLLLVILFFGYLVQGAGEELLIRGYFAVSVGSRYPMWISMIVSSMLFSVMHLGNNAFSFLPALNIFLVGMIFFLFIVKRGSIWGACAIHSMWNFAQGCIFGLSVSGTTKTASIFHSWVSPYNQLLAGGDFGPEGGICTTVVLIAAFTVVFSMPPKSSQPAVPSPQDQTADL